MSPGASVEAVAEYQPRPGAYDECFAAPGQPRAHYAELIAAIADAGPGRLAAAVREGVRAREVTFSAAPEGFLALDPVPRVLTAAEWDVISRGIAQRARGLDRFVADVYGPREILGAGIVPVGVVEGSAHFEPAMMDAPPPREWVSVIGFDLVRSPDGRFLVLEDQIRMPSGIAYAAAARAVMEDVLSLPVRPCDLGDPIAALGEALRSVSPGEEGDPSIALVSEGREAAGWYEHERMRRELGIAVLSLSDLERRGDGLWGRSGEESFRLDVVYQRTEEDRFTDSEGHPTRLGELLLDPCRAGTVACVNAPGSGIGDDKAVHAYVEEMIRFYLGEDPIIGSVRTLDLTDPRRREEVLGDRDGYVFKPRGEMGGEGVVVWSHATRAERAEVERLLAADAEDLIAQERIELSCHPTVCDGRLVPRRVDLRPYVIRSHGREWAMPGGLTRVALGEGSMIVNSGQGGGVKDTWVLGDQA
jgi:uncharacterized circularly permuted ATP-grasp superfamily protein